MQVDTIKLNLPLDSAIMPKLILTDPRVEKKSTQKMLSNEVHETHKISCDGIIGLNSIVIHSNETCSIQLSAKTLKKNYKDLISNNNIEQALNQVNELECMQIDVPEAIDRAICYRVDPCIDFIPEGYTKAELFTVLSAIANRSYCLRPYKYDGITIEKNAKSNNNRLCIYDKADEITKDQELLQYIQLDDFKNKIRIELNLRKFRYAKKYLNLPKQGNVKLTEVLNSNLAPAQTFWNEFERPVKHKYLYDDAWKAKDVNQFNAMLAQRYLLEKKLNKTDIESMYQPLYKDKRYARQHMRRAIEPLQELIKRKAEPKFDKILSHFKKCLDTQNE